MKYLAIALALTLSGCSSANPFAPNPCDPMGAAPKDCGPVYAAPHCIEVPSGVVTFFKDLHESVFDCEPNPMGASPCDPHTK